MEHPPQTSKYTVTHDSNLLLFIGSPSYIDPDLMELQSSSASTSLSTSQKRKRNQVVPRDIIEIDEDDDQDGVVIIGENLLENKSKQPIKFEKDVFPFVYESSYTKLKSESVAPSDKQKGFVLDPLDFSFTDEYDYTEYEDDYDDEDDYDLGVSESDNNLTLAAQFDELDLPPGVEATVPWLQSDASKMLTVKPNLIIEDEIDLKFKAFKQFDTVRDNSDHYFNRPELLKITPSVKKPGKDWAKRIQHEWKVLEKDLPETIYVRIYEDRMDLLRAVIIGPAGTPYHDGLFFFDVYFPPAYPMVPPMVHYHSGGLRLNPNLYACGKVCLSLLNTWSGHGCEKWNPTNSTMLQVLVSIQALVLNAKPYFNEPGYANSANTPHGETRSLAYNEDVFILSCKTMLYSLRRPPTHFEDFVAGHFRNHGRNILVACRAYTQGAQVGCVVGNGVQDVDQGDKSSSSTFQNNLSTLFEQLLMEFTVKGADCDMFLAQKVKDGTAAAKAAAGPSGKGQHH
ncbi:putative ubiquitin-conjugating enzyme E2 38 [Phalaenopsis equestris]|uniref:putative ubiquitin-conjugating enzyme E2 38 n=1 Tax=Phalaenopsis equestris TaxID=78828 RepID=UPI0009E4E329|nr:putative ubiquitin-conjugating enzyme E2 38 [Phalaenopsis equestris]